MPPLTKEQSFLVFGVILVISLNFMIPLIGMRVLSLFSNLLGKGPGVRIGGLRLSDDARVRHTHIVGATGSGKSVLLEHFIYQDMERGLGAFIVDPKGDRGFYNQIKDYCAGIGREDDLYLLSASHPEDSGNWNPCGLGSSSELQSKFYNANIYHEPYYAKACELGLLQAFRALRDDSEADINLEMLVKELERIARKQKDNVLSGLFLDFANLAESEWGQVLAPVGDSRRHIDLMEIVKHRKILFVDLPTEAKKVQSARVGRLLTQELMLISGRIKIQPELKPELPFSVYVDEFDAFATESFATFLNKARSSNFMIHIAHQTLSDLNKVGADFSGQILGNCNNRFIFRQDDPDDAERWARFIGTRTTTKRTFQSVSGTNTGRSSNREAQEFIISPDQIKSLKVGRCVYSSKTAGISKICRIPMVDRTTGGSPQWSCAPLVKRTGGCSHQSSILPVVELTSSETNHGYKTPKVKATTGQEHQWLNQPVVNSTTGADANRSVEEKWKCVEQLIGVPNTSMEKSKDV